jgi:hypothetical protein
MEGIVGIRFSARKRANVYLPDPLHPPDLLSNVVYFLPFLVPLVSWW